MQEKIGDYGRSDAYPYPIPKEIWFLVDHLYRNGMKQRHLFEQPGLHAELLAIRDWLDLGVPEHLRILKMSPVGPPIPIPIPISISIATLAIETCE